MNTLKQLIMPQAKAVPTGMPRVPAPSRFAIDPPNSKPVPVPTGSGMSRRGRALGMKRMPT